MQRRIGWLIGLTTLIGCGYQPGSYQYYARDNFPGQRGTVGCLDLAVQRRDDMPVGPVLSYQFANRCDHLTTIDLAAVTVIARGASGRSHKLTPYDPDGVLRPVELDGRTAAGEALAYWGAAGAAEPILEICADVAPLGRLAQPAWRCFPTAVASSPAAGPPTVDALVSQGLARPVSRAPLAGGGL
jgi:hypothetical protein